jgi:hypothetical protein
MMDLLRHFMFYASISTKIQCDYDSDWVNVYITGVGGMLASTPGRPREGGEKTPWYTMTAHVHNYHVKLLVNPSACP